MNQKMYKISEDNLRFLVEAEVAFNALQCAGVYNWKGYGEAFSEAIRDFKEEYDLSPDTEVDMDNIVDKEMERYEIL